MKETHSDKEHLEMDLEHQSLIERVFEGTLWSTRFFVLLAVVFSMVGGILLFIVASADVIGVVKLVFNVYINHIHPENFHEILVSELIGAVDLYLIAIVLFLFGFGLYELFISQIDIAKKSPASRVLEIHSLDELKDKLAKVIIMVLMVGFFKRAMNTTYGNAMDMLSLAASIFLIALAFYFMHKGGNSHE